MVSNFLVSKSAYHEDTFSNYENYKRAILLGQLCLLIGAIFVTYIFLDSYHQRFNSIPYYITAVITCSVVLLLNRVGYFKIASFILLSMMILLLYVFTDNDSNRLGTHMYLVVYTLVAITLYGYESKAWSLFFLVLATICFYVAYLEDLPPVIKPPPFPASLKQTYFIANFIIVLVLTSLLVFFLISINYKANRRVWDKSQQLVKVNNELDRFVYSASHDLKAPLNSLNGLIALSKHSNDVSEIKNYLDMMTKSVSNLDSFIHEIIEFSRNTKTAINIETCNVLELVKEVIDSLKFSVNMERIHIENSISPDLIVATDPYRLKVILHNIVGNGMKYHDPSQANPWIKLSGEVNAGHLIIEVEDNGIGIAEENKSKIFDMFFRATNKLAGSGLGLYIVKETIEKLNGQIKMTSELGKGSMFRIEIPIN